MLTLERSTQRNLVLVPRRDLTLVQWLINNGVVSQPDDLASALKVAWETDSVLEVVECLKEYGPEIFTKDVIVSFPDGTPVLPATLQQLNTFVIEKWRVIELHSAEDEWEGERQQEWARQIFEQSQLALRAGGRALPKASRRVFHAVVLPRACLGLRWRRCCCSSEQRKTT